MLTDKLYYLPHDIRRALFARLRRTEYKSLQNQRFIDTCEGYSFKPFDQKQCIFVHIPKAAGISICKSLFGNLGGGHTTIDQYRIIFSKNEFNNYFKFTFVRNPWSRVYSAYSFLKKGGMNVVDKKWSEENLSSFIDFNHFIQAWLNKDNIQKYIHFKPQYEFLCLPHNKKICLDFLGLFENIQEDFQFIKKKLVLDDNLTLRFDNRTVLNVKQAYMDSYTDESIDIVADVYKDDIDLFGYSFDNSTLKSQLNDRSAWIFNHT